MTKEIELLTQIRDLLSAQVSDEVRQEIILSDEDKIKTILKNRENKKNVN